MNKEGPLDKKIRVVVNGGKRENRKIRRHGKQGNKEIQRRNELPWLLELKKKVCGV